MPSNEKTIGSQFSYLEKWFSQNKKINLRSVAIQSSSATMNWDGLEDYQSSIISELKAYQRVLKILPNKDHQLIMKLLQVGIYSAIQVASMSKQNFLTSHSHLFSGKKVTAEDFYNNALAIKNRLLLKHLQQIS